MDPVQLANLAPNVALIAALIIAVRYMTNKADAANAKVVELLTDTLDNNTQALHTVADVISRCPNATATGTQFIRNPTPTPHNHKP